MIKPKFILLAAVSADGYIAKYSGHASDWTSPEDKDHLHAELDKCSAVVVGRKTYELAAKPLRARNVIVLTRGQTRLEHSRLRYVNPANVSLVELLGRENWLRVAVLGGMEIYNYCLENNLFDELYLTIEPVLFGSGVRLLSTATLSPKLMLVNNRTLNQQGTILIHYRKFYDN